MAGIMICEQECCMESGLSGWESSDIQGKEFHHWTADGCVVMQEVIGDGT